MTSLLCNAKVLNSHLPNTTSLIKTLQDSIKGKAKSSRIIYTPEMTTALQNLLENIQTTPSIYDINNQRIEELLIYSDAILLLAKFKTAKTTKNYTDKETDQIVLIESYSRKFCSVEQNLLVD